MASILPHGVRGDRAEPVVFLHGFAADRGDWDAVAGPVSAVRRTIAFDLPGHGAALDWPEIGHAGVAAKAVIGSLDGLGIGRCHLVGHSMGGAAAVIAAQRLAGSGRVASLTLLAPGGFGPEIDQRLLRRYAVATGLDAILPLYEQFFGYESAVPEATAAAMAARRRDPRVVAAMALVVEAILDGGRQKCFDLAMLTALPHPVRVLWGDQDRVLPARQTRRLPGTVAVHVFHGVGHMPHLEVPDATARLILQAVAGA